MHVRYRADYGHNPETDKIDIYRSTKSYFDQHRNQATCQAAMKADAILEVGDMEGSATWRKIIKAIEVLQATEPRGMTH